MMLLKRQRIPHCPKNNLILRLKTKPVTAGKGSKGICPVFVRIRYNIGTLYSRIRLIVADSNLAKVMRTYGIRPAQLLGQMCL